MDKTIHLRRPEVEAGARQTSVGLSAADDDEFTPAYFNV